MEAEQASRDEELATRRQAAAKALLPEQGAVRIQARFADGKKLARRFEPHATVADLVAWVDCVGYLPGGTDGTVVPARFELVIPFPSRALRDLAMTLAEAGLVPSGAVLVQDLDA